MLCQKNQGHKDIQLAFKFSPKGWRPNLTKRLSVQQHRQNKLTAIKNIRSNKQYHDTHNNPYYYLLNQPHRAFPNIKFKNTSPKEIENIIRSLKAKEFHGYDEITTKM